MYVAQQLRQEMKLIIVFLFCFVDMKRNLVEFLTYYFIECLKLHMLKWCRIDSLHMKYTVFNVVAVKLIR